MREFLARHRAAIVAFIGLLVPLFLLYVHGRSPRKTTIIEAFLISVTSPVQGAAAKVLGGISDVWNGYVALIDVEAENEALRAKIREYVGKADRVDQLELENLQLRAMLNFKKARRDLELVGAHVIGKDVSPYARVLRIEIDVGEDTEIREGMPVIDPSGVVGRIHLVSGSAAEVMLTVDARSTINVKVLDKGVTGTLKGTNSQYAYTAHLLYLHKAKPLEVGDVLVTSGHDKVFPPGIRVGEIQSIEERQRDVEFELDVRPSVNFSAVDVVYVVTDVREGPALPPPAAPKPSPAVDRKADKTGVGPK